MGITGQRAGGTVAPSHPRHLDRYPAGPQRSLRGHRLVEGEQGVGLSLGQQRGCPEPGQQPRRTGGGQHRPSLGAERAGSGSVEVGGADRRHEGRAHTGRPRRGPEEGRCPLLLQHASGIEGADQGVPGGDRHDHIDPAVQGGRQQSDTAAVGDAEEGHPGIPGTVPEDFGPPRQPVEELAGVRHVVVGAGQADGPAGPAEAPGRVEQDFVAPLGQGEGQGRPQLVLVAAEAVGADDGRHRTGGAGPHGDVEGGVEAHVLVAAMTVDDRDAVVLDPVAARAGGDPRGTTGRGEPGGNGPSSRPGGAGRRGERCGDTGGPGRRSELGGRNGRQDEDSQHHGEQGERRSARHGRQ